MPMVVTEERIMALDDDVDPGQEWEPAAGPDASTDLDAAPATKQSRLISRVLAPAVRLWVRSQLDHVEDLHITIEAGDRQLLGGGIDSVSASASKAVYQGLHFSRIQVAGQGIQTNLGQMLRGKPFRLLDPFPVVGEVSLSEADLNASLNAPLLATAVTDFMLSLLQPDGTDATAANSSLQNVQVQFGENELTLTAILTTPTTETAIAVRTGLAIKKGNLLKLEGFQHQPSVDQLVPIHASPTNVTIPLGSDVYLDTLSIQENHLICQGRITVMPGE